MISLHLNSEQYQDVFTHLLQVGRISAPGHIGTHLDCYTKAPEQPEYELSAYVLDCTAGMPDAAAVTQLPNLSGQALILRTGNEEAHRYGYEA